MEVTFLNAKDDSELLNTKVLPNSAIIGLSVTNGSTLTKEGFPQFRFYHDIRVVTFGVQRLHKPEERASLVSIAGQVYSFVTHNPTWNPVMLFRPIYDITPDDSLAAVLLDSEVRDDILAAGTKLSAILGELIEWTSNKYAFMKQSRPRFLNNFLNQFPYPFKDIPNTQRTASCKKYLEDQWIWWHQNIVQLEAVERVFPMLKYDRIFGNEESAFILIEGDKYGSDDLVAQQYFQANPGMVRLVLVKKVHGSQKHSVNIYNSNLYNANLQPYPYPNVKELNAQERKLDGDASWKNLKVFTSGPKKGTVLDFETMWNSVKIGE